MIMSDYPLMTVAEIADELQIAKMTVYRLLHSGKLPYFRIGGSYRVRREDLSLYLEANRVEASSQE
jgi:excisionase family DNA binding protein